MISADQFFSLLAWLDKINLYGSEHWTLSHKVFETGQVTLFWTLTSTDIFFAVRAERKSGYLAIALGRCVSLFSTMLFNF